MLVTVYRCLRGIVPRDTLVDCVHAAITAYLPGFPREAVAAAVDCGVVLGTTPVPVPPEYAEAVDFVFSLDPLGLDGDMSGRRRAYRAEKDLWRRWLIGNGWDRVRSTMHLVTSLEVDGTPYGDVVTVRFFLPYRALLECTQVRTMAYLQSADEVPHALRYFAPLIVELETPEVNYLEFYIAPTAHLFLTIVSAHVLRYVEPSPTVSVWEQSLYPRVPPIVFREGEETLFGTWGYHAGYVFRKVRGIYYRAYVPARVREEFVSLASDDERWHRCIASLNRSDGCP